MPRPIAKISESAVIRIELLEAFGIGLSTLKQAMNKFRGTFLFGI